MTTKNVGANTLKAGSYLLIDGAACRVGNIQVSRPGKHGHAKMRVEGVGIVDGKKRIIVIPGHDSVEVPVIGKNTAQVLSVQDSSANVMDAETYETFDVIIPAELKADCVPGCNILYWQVLNDRIMKQVKPSEG